MWENFQRVIELTERERCIDDWWNEVSDQIRSGSLSDNWKYLHGKLVQGCSLAARSLPAPTPPPGDAVPGGPGSGQQRQQVPDQQEPREEMRLRRRRSSALVRCHRVSILHSFEIRPSNSSSGSVTKAPLALHMPQCRCSLLEWKAASGIWLFSNKDCHDGRNWRDGRSQFPLDMCYCGCSKLWAAQGTQSPELRAAFLLVGMAATCSPPHLGAHPKTPNHMAQQRNPPGAPRTHLTLHGRARGTHTEPTGNPPGTQQEPAWQSERNPRGAYESPPGTHREPTPNRI